VSSTFNDSKRRPSPTKKPAGISRRLDKDSGRWINSDFNSALLQAMLKGLQSNRRKGAKFK
jgi:hypothetical protein